MNSNKIFSFLRGCLTVCADGPFTERLINICMHRGMPIWDIKHIGSARIVFKTDIPSFRSIRTPAKRTKSRVRILKRHGLPFIIHRYRHRYLSVLGGIIPLIFLIYASTHVMGITVFGNTRISTQDIMSALGECGLSLGIKTSSVEPASIRNQMMTKLDNLAWIGINANGSRVYIEIVERIEKQEGIPKDGVSCHLVASKDGEIEALEVREGQTLVKVGSGVCKGDILVSGIIDNTANGFRFVQARGEVFAKTSYSKTGEFPLEYTENIATGEQKNKYTLSLLNLEIPLFLGKKEPFPKYSYEESINEYRLPIDIIPSLFIKKQSYLEEIPQEKKRTPSQAISHGIKQLSAELKAQLPQNAEIIEEKNSHTLNERGMVEVSVEFICRENIAESFIIEKALPDDTDSPIIPYKQKIR